VVVSLIFCFSMILSVSAQSNICSPTIKLINQDPNPAIPDDYVKVLFEVTDLSNCGGFAVKLNPQYPFSLDSNSSATQTINSIPFGVDAKNSWMVPYKVRIDKDAFDGDYNLKLQFHSGSSEDFRDFYAESSFNVSIKDSRIAFDAVIQEATGNSVSIAIANVGKYAANSVVVRIPEQDSFSVSGTDGQMVGNLASGDYTLVGFTISPKTNFANNYSKGQIPRNQTNIGSISPTKLKFDIYYTDNIGIRRIINMELPLKLGNTTALGIPGAYGRARTVSTPWYSSWSTWIIILIVLGVLYYLYKKYGKKEGKLKKLFDRKGSASQSTSEDLPDWIKNSKEKRK